MQLAINGHTGGGKQSNSHRFAISFATLIVFAVCGIILAVNAPSASASTSFFCGGQVLGGRGNCMGAARTMYAEEAWGGTHSVCATYTVEGSTVTASCSGGPGEHTYHEFGGSIYTEPGVYNQGETANEVQGFAYEP